MTPTQADKSVILRETDRDAAVDLAHALGMTCEDFTSGQCDVLLFHLARHASAAREEALEQAAIANIRRLPGDGPNFYTTQCVGDGLDWSLSAPTREGVEEIVRGFYAEARALKLPASDEGGAG